ncbi:hypothetical protein AB1Y20_009935 [Prymnesium parvum]|uniref:Uncharacterized protein n=1 Tax=Prymnesium parvum TaxID=97485 RepID=A0AB34K7F3_PRYPA|mmetsp:Transcript_47655/g.118002  ORF Transcript_47655/g.118002 Transcript_47655/m.118002 type:complete len:337 (-) Transcript_47655:195-1205(-)
MIWFPMLLLVAGAHGGLRVTPARPHEAHAKPRPSQDGAHRARHFAASALAGAAGVTLLAPVEVIRISLMVNTDHSLRDAMKALSSQGGWFRGNTADTLAAALKVGVTMPAYAFFKQALTHAARRNGPLQDDHTTPRWATFAAGALAGAVATAVTFPLDVVRTRLAMACPVDMNIATCMILISEEEGKRALYRGLSATLAGVLPFSSIKLATYDILRRGATAGVDDSSQSLSVAQSALFGALAGSVAATSCFPLEVIRRRQMMGGFAGLSTFAATSAIIKAEGVSVLFNGVGLNIVKVAMSNSIGFAFYELAKDVLQVEGRTPPWKTKSVSLACSKA